MSETLISPEISKEERRKEIVERLLQLKKEGVGDSSLNNEKVEEMRRLDKELLEIDPIDSTYTPPPDGVERRTEVRKEDRALIQEHLDELRKNKTA